MPQGSSVEKKSADQGRSSQGETLGARREEFTVVAIGASAGGLEACSKFLSTLPARTGMAYIIVQHLDPVHESLLAELLAAHTTMPVGVALDGAVIEPDHVYVIAPGTFISISGRALHVRPTPTQRGVRLPFDFLLHAMASVLRERSACVVLSGTGEDGSSGLVSIKDQGGWSSCRIRKKRRLTGCRILPSTPARSI